MTANVAPLGPVVRRLQAPPSRLSGAPPSVTVVIPCYNYARFLPASVASALDQAGVVVDVIIVDDASTDGSRAVARSLARDDSRIKVLSHAVNKGPVATFNDGLAIALGEFLVRLDADDMLAPGALMRAAALFRAYPSVGLVYGHPLHFSGDRLPAARTAATGWTVWPGRAWLADRCRSGYNVITSPEVVMRKSVVDRVGGQRELAHTHDMEMWLRLAAFSDIAYIHGADQAYHREHSASLSARKVDVVRDLEERLAAFDLLFEGPAGGVPGASAMRADACRAVAGQAVRYACREYDHGRENMPLVRALTEIATRAAGDLRAAPGWVGLERRMRRGPSSRRPLALVARAVRRVEYDISQWRWRRTGVY